MLPAREKYTTATHDAGVVAVGGIGMPGVQLAGLAAFDPGDGERHQRHRPEQHRDGAGDSLEHRRHRLT